MRCSTYLWQRDAGYGCISAIPRLHIAEAVQDGGRPRIEWTTSAVLEWTRIECWHKRIAGAISVLPQRRQTFRARPVGGDTELHWDRTHKSGTGRLCWMMMPVDCFCLLNLIPSLPGNFQHCFHSDWTLTAKVVKNDEVTRFEADPFKGQPSAAPPAASPRWPQHGRSVKVKSWTAQSSNDEVFTRGIFPFDDELSPHDDESSD